LALLAVATVVVAGILAALWGPLAPTRLFDFDAVNFALALDYFQPAAHQPQPPGYPLYVALTKLIHLAVDDVAFTFLAAGLLGATAAVVMLWILGERMFGRQAGILSALLFMTNPILWQTGISDQVRIFIAVISIGVALALWPLYNRGQDARFAWQRFALCGFVLGLSAGFRPEMLASMAPLPLLVAWRCRMNLRGYLAGALAVLVGVAPWAIVLLLRVGGIDGFLAMMRVYSAEQAGGSSVLFGAGWDAAAKMIESGLWWFSLGVACWAPAILLVRWRKVSGDEKRNAAFLALWFVPLFLFSIAVHIAASGHALGFIPVLCLAGGWVLSSIGKTNGRLLMIACAFAALIANVVLFFEPYSDEVKEASYQTVSTIREANETTLRKIDWVTQQGPAFLVSDNASVSWRILEYYYPKTPLVYLPEPFAPESNQPVWLIQHRLRVRDVDPRSDIALPSCGTVVWLISDPQAKRDLLAIPGADDERYFIATPVHAGMHFRVGRYQLATSARDCVSQTSYSP
jgi:hypothetical protein